MYIVHYRIRITNKYDIGNVVYTSLGRSPAGPGNRLIFGVETFSLAGVLFPAVAGISLKQLPLFLRLPVLSLVILALFTGVLGAFDGESLDGKCLSELCDCTGKLLVKPSLVGADEALLRSDFLLISDIGGVIN